MATSHKRKAPAMSLSKGLMQMKFMQRTRLKQEELDALEAQRQLQEKYLPSSSSQSVSQTVTRFVYVDSYYAVQNLKFGRMSFFGFNPEVEKLMSYYENLEKTKEEKEHEEPADVGQYEMTERFKTVVDSIAKKYRRKRERNFNDDNQEEEEEIVAVKQKPGSNDQNPSRPKAKVRKFLRPSD